MTAVGSLDRAKRANLQVIFGWACFWPIQVIFVAVALSSIAAAIPMRWWRMMARLKAHNPLRRSAWSAADRPDNNVADMAIPLAPSNLRPDSMAPAGAKRAMPFRLI